MSDKTAKEKGAILKIELDNGKVGYFKAPNRYVQGVFFAKYKDNPVAAIEGLLNGCIMAEFSDINMNDDSEFQGCVDQASVLIEYVNTNKKKSTATLL